jgi:hypothetical protein
MVAAWVGEKNLACELLTSAARLPAGPHYGELKLYPFWDPLRSDPAFQKLCEEKQP